MGQSKTDFSLARQPIGFQVTVLQQPIRNACDVKDEQPIRNDETAGKHPMADGKTDVTLVQPSVIECKKILQPAALIKTGREGFDVATASLGDMPHLHQVDFDSKQANDFSQTLVLQHVKDSSDAVQHVKDS